MVRHGESFGNLQGLSQGHADYELTEKGIEQAKKIALRLKDEKIDFAYSSNLKRCSDTAEEIMKFHPYAKLILTNELREQAKGIWEGKNQKERDEAIRKASVEYHEFIFEGGEKYDEMFKRVISFFEKIKKKHKNEYVLIVSHGSPIASLTSYLLGKELRDAEQFVPKNTGISIFEINEKDIKIESENCTKHLKCSKIS